MKNGKKGEGCWCSIQFQYIPYQYVQIPCCWLVITAKEEQLGSIISRMSNQNPNTSPYNYETMI